jgi:transcriptional/translational regulatory protein YebC/TACO1
MSKQNDAQKKMFGKLNRLITVESKAAKGNLSSPGSGSNKKARKEICRTTIDRAVKKGSTDMENIVYETYGPGGVAILISALTDNRNKTAQEINTFCHQRI